MSSEGWLIRDKKLALMSLSLLRGSHWPRQWTLCSSVRCGRDGRARRSQGVSSSGTLRAQVSGGGRKDGSAPRGEAAPPSASPVGPGHLRHALQTRLWARRSRKVLAPRETSPGYG